MEDSNYNIDSDIKTKLLSLNLFQEKKDLILFEIAKIELFESLLFLKKNSSPTIEIDNIPRILQEIK